ncbi:MAG: porphobilinogen synthase, partial [Gemmataceae bacterium]|nr:porphobilinogen synthase [Gemmataceae bacterium]
MTHPHPSDAPFPPFPTSRPRRLRYNPLVRELVRETELNARDLILPLFVRPGRGVRQEIGSMPGNFQLSTDTLVDEIGAARDLGIK